jgi:hypothetical protein
MDIWIALHPRNAAKMVEVLRDFGFVVEGLSPVNFISLKHLKTNKQASGRLKDLSDLEHLP